MNTTTLETYPHVRYIALYLSNYAMQQRMHMTTHTQEQADITPQEPFVRINTTVLEYVFYQTNTPNIYTALLEAADHFAAFHTGLPDIIVMNTERRIRELPVEYWHRVFHGSIPIELRSPIDIEIEEVKGTPLYENTFICLRRIEEEENKK